MPSFTPNSVWSPIHNREATEHDQKLNAPPQIAGYSVRTEGFDFQGVDRPKKNTTASHFEKSYSGPATFTTEDDRKTRINHTGHNAQVDDFVRVTYPFYANSIVKEVDSSGFVTNIYYHTLTGFLPTQTGVTYQLGTGNPNQTMIFVGVNSQSSQDSDRVKLNDIKIMKDDNVTSMMRAGLIYYSSISGLWYNPFNPATTGNPTYRISFIPEGLDSETRITGGGYSINGKYTVSDGRRKKPKQSRTYKGKGQS